MNQLKSFVLGGAPFYLNFLLVKLKSLKDRFGKLSQNQVGSTLSSDMRDKIVS